jgi:anti-anti-sigma regulatory factor
MVPWIRDFSKEMIHRGAREFILDLCNCPLMDSTFMGTLAAISLWLRELGEGGLSVVNLNERNAESLLSLGLHQLLNVRVSAIREDGQALSNTAERRRPHRSGTDDAGSSRGLDQNGV